MCFFVGVCDLNVIMGNIIWVSYIVVLVGYL